MKKKICPSKLSELFIFVKQIAEKKKLAKLGLLWDVKLYVVNHLYLLEGSFRKKFKNFSIKNLFKKIPKKI